MVIFELLKIGIRNLLAHKLRSFLSVLGVVFGVAAVITMISIGEGARREALEQIRLLGTNNIIIRALDLDEHRRIEARKNLSMGLTLTDARRIQNISPMIDKVFALEESLEEARFGEREIGVHLVATTPDYIAVSGIRMAEGRFLTSSDLESSAKVSVLGWSKYRELFPSGGGLGKYIEIKSELFRVIGVISNRDLPKKENPVVQIRDINSDIYIPLNQLSVGSSSENTVDQIMIHVRETDHVIPAAQLAQAVLERRHNRVVDYEIIVPQELIKQSQRTQRIFNFVMGSIAGISLLVGGIGIMNIMLAVITERTREIGIRRALGATKKDILRQFLVETMVLTITGGCVGVIFGIFGAWGIHLYVEWRTVVSGNAVIAAFSVSVMVGIIFGMYPAYKAANMNPIEALRYE